MGAGSFVWSPTFRGGGSDMKINSYAATGMIAACLMLGACGGDDEADESSAENAVDAGEMALADDAAALAEPAATPPAEAAGVAIGIDDVVGVWGNAELCAVEPLIIGPDFVSVSDEACIVTGLNSTEAGLAIELLCPVEGAEPRPETWTVTTLGEAVPADGIAVLRDGETAELLRCASE